MTDDPTGTLADLDAERQLLGRLMAGDTLSVPVNPDAFYRSSHRLVFDAITTLTERGEPPDPSAVLDVLTRTGKLEAAGDGPGLHELVAAGTNALGNADTYARRVADSAALRRIVTAGQEIAAQAQTAPDAPTAVRTAAALLEQATDTVPSAEPFPLYGPDDLDDLPQVEWIIDGLVQDREGILIYGPRGSGKSLAALDLGLHIAAGTDWRGRTVHGGPVVLCALENADALPQRIRAWQNAHPDHDTSRFHFTTARIRATGQLDEQRLHATLDTLHESPALVIIDTQQRFAAGLDEISGQDMQVVVDWLDRLRDHTGHAVGLVHHAGKDPARGARGSSVLEASFTAVASIDKTTAGVVTLTADKVNNGPEGWDHAWAIRVGQHGPHLHPLNPHAPLLAKLREIRQAVDDEPGITKRELEGAVTGKATAVRSAIEDALHHGVIVNRGTGRAHAYHPGEIDPETACPDPSQNGQPGTHVSQPQDTTGHTPELPV